MISLILAMLLACGDKEVEDTATAEEQTQEPAEEVVEEVEEETEVEDSGEAE